MDPLQILHEEIWSSCNSSSAFNKDRSAPQKFVKKLQDRFVGSSLCDSFKFPLGSVSFLPLILDLTAKTHPYAFIVSEWNYSETFKAKGSMTSLYQKNCIQKEKLWWSGIHYAAYSSLIGVSQLMKYFMHELSGKSYFGKFLNRSFYMYIRKLKRFFSNPLYMKNHDLDVNEVR